MEILIVITLTLAIILFFVVIALACRTDPGDAELPLITRHADQLAHAVLVQHTNGSAYTRMLSYKYGEEHVLAVIEDASARYPQLVLTRLTRFEL